MRRRRCRCRLSWRVPARGANKSVATRSKTQLEWMIPSLPLRVLTRRPRGDSGGIQLIRDDSQSASALMTQRNPIMTNRTQILAVTSTALIVGYVFGYYFGGGV